MWILESNTSTGNTEKVDVQAIVLEFNKSVDLGTTGHTGARPDGNKYSIQPKRFGAGTDGAEMVRVLREMKEQYC